MRAVALAGSALALALTASGCTAALRGPSASPARPEQSAAGEDEIVIAPVERRAEARWLAALGLRPPSGPVLLERPFAEPLTRRSFIVPAEWYRAERPRQIAPRDLLRDLDVLEQALPRVYGGYERAEARGFRFADWLSAWRAELAAAERPLPASKAFAPMAELSALQLDNHTGPLVGVRYGSGSSSVLLEEDPDELCTRIRMTSGDEIALDLDDPAQQPKDVAVPSPRSGALRPGVYLTYPARRGELASVYCGSRWIRATHADPTPLRDRFVGMLRLLGRRSEREDSPGYARLARDVGYLRVPTLGRGNAAKLRALAPRLPADAGRERALIVDLRFNEGGDGESVYPALARWLDLEAIARDTSPSRIEKRSCLADAMRWGYTQMSISDMIPPLPDDLVGELQSQLDGLFGVEEPGCPVTLVETEATFGYSTRHFEPEAARPTVLVLVNESCASDCEHLTYLLARDSRVVVAGVNTFGAIQFDEPAYTVLPRSRVVFGIARGVSDVYGDGRSIDGYGLDVDVLLPTAAHHGSAALVALARSVSARR